MLVYWVSILLQFKSKELTALTLGHLTLEPVKCIKYQGYQQSHMCGSQGTHGFSWGLFHSCRRSVRTPQWQHSTTVQRKRKPSLDWWLHHMAMCSANQLLYPTAPQPRSEQERIWGLLLKTSPAFADWPGYSLTAVSAPLPLQGLQEEATATRELSNRVCREGLGLSAHSPWDGRMTASLHEDTLLEHGLYPNRYTPRLLTVQTRRESGPPREPFTPGVMQAAMWQPMLKTNRLQSRCSNHILPSPLQHQIHQEFNTILTKWCSQTYSPISELNWGRETLH